MIDYWIIKNPNQSNTDDSLSTKIKYNNKNKSLIWENSLPIGYFFLTDVVYTRSIKILLDNSYKQWKERWNKNDALNISVVEMAWSDKAGNTKAEKTVKGQIRR